MLCQNVIYARRSKMNVVCLLIFGQSIFTGSVYAHIFGKTTPKITVSEEDLLDQLVNASVPRIQHDFRTGQKWMEALVRTFGYERNYYAVVVDCGSSGSRVHAYKFRIPEDAPVVFGGQPQLEVVSELFEMTHPGLSAYANSPLQGAAVIFDLVSEAQNLVPRPRRSDTPLIVRATAGMRMLPKHKANKLLWTVYNRVSRCGYDMSLGVRIMEGSEEGIYLWYSVNWLMNRFDKATYAALDLGGGSTQITFEIDEESATMYPPANIHRIHDVKNYTIFTHSYLNMGRFAARFGILLKDANNDSTYVNTPCMHPGYKNIQAQYKPPGGVAKMYSFSGLPYPSSMSNKEVLDRCVKNVKSFIDKTTDGLMPRVRGGGVVGVSYIHDLAAITGVIDAQPRNDKVPKRAQVGSFRVTAETACTTYNESSPYNCLELAYVHTLLNYVYGIPDEQEIILSVKVDGYDLAWPMGIAYISLIRRLKEVQRKFKEI